MTPRAWAVLTTWGACAAVLAQPAIRLSDALHEAVAHYEQQLRSLTERAAHVREANDEALRACVADACQREAGRSCRARCERAHARDERLVSEDTQTLRAEARAALRARLLALCGPQRTDQRANRSNEEALCDFVMHDFDRGVLTSRLVRAYAQTGL